MRIASLIALMSLLLTSCNNNTKASASGNGGALARSIDPEEVKVKVRGLLDDLWTQGYAEKDTSIVSALYHPNFNLVDDEGSVFNRDAEMAYVVNYGEQYLNFSYTIDKFHVFENGNAVVFAKCKFMGTDASGKVFVTDYFQSVTFSMFSEQWRIIHSQVSGVKESIIDQAPSE